MFFVGKENLYQSVVRHCSDVEVQQGPSGQTAFELVALKLARINHPMWAWFPLVILNSSKTQKEKEKKLNLYTWVMFQYLSHFYATVFVPCTSFGPNQHGTHLVYFVPFSLFGLFHPENRYSYTFSYFHVTKTWFCVTAESMVKIHLGTAFEH